MVWRAPDSNNIGYAHWTSSIRHMTARITHTDKFNRIVWPTHLMFPERTVPAVDVIHWDIGVRALMLKADRRFTCVCVRRGRYACGARTFVFSLFCLSVRRQHLPADAMRLNNMCVAALAELNSGHAAPEEAEEHADAEMRCDICERTHSLSEFIGGDNTLFKCPCCLTVAHRDCTIQKGIGDSCSEPVGVVLQWPTSLLARLGGGPPTLCSLCTAHCVV